MQEKRSILFIIGCQRSGTTMLASLLNASEQCETAPESQFKFSLLNDREFDHTNSDRLDKDFRFKLWKQDLGFLKGKSFSNYEIFSELIQERFKREDSFIFVDHTPENVEYVGQLMRYFPNAKFLHLIRDGRGVYQSLKNVVWGPKDPITAARWWQKKVAWGLACQHLVPRQNYFSVRYEDILSQPFETMTSISHWLEIEFNERMLVGDNNFLPDYTKSQHQLVGRKINVSNIDRWRTSLSDEEIYFFQRETKNLLSNLGYSIITNEYKKTMFSELKLRFRGMLEVRKNSKKFSKKKASILNGNKN